MGSLRRKWVSDSVLNWFKRALPPLSETETQAMEAGSIWWEGELFSGAPAYQTLLDYPKPTLSEREQSFIDNQLNQLLAMVDDFSVMNHDRNLSPEVWDFLRKERFFSLIIDQKFGGLGFSSYANSTIVTKIATRSISAAVTVMVPNSLGPGELLSHYGTQEQQDYWLPRLADGREIPCFALTGPEAGSDAGSIPDNGIVCMGEHEGEQVLGIRLNWNKRYITLAPVATVLGLAFKLYDPDHLLGEQTALGITCALIPVDHPGVVTGERHDPMGLAFMNGPTRGEDVFIPMDWLIGGTEYAGKGWRMLVECLSAGRGISLPALGAALGHLSLRTTGAYSYVRKQFGLSIGRFEGVAESLGRIGGLTYLLEATRTLTTTGLDLGENPGVVTAIAKYHMTELGRLILTNAMDVHAGRAIQRGPMNYFSAHYLGVPIAITVEGANILTRNLMIFGQGAIRCHPYILKEMEAAANPDTQEGKKAFDRWLFKHIAHTSKNALRGFAHGLTGNHFVKVPKNVSFTRPYQHITRLSAGLALLSDVAMLTLGGQLKRKELLSARLGDALAHLYMASAVMKRFHDEGEKAQDRPFVDYALQHCFYQAAHALDETCVNFPKPWLGKVLKRLIFPLGQGFSPPNDRSTLSVARLLMKPGEQRDRFSHLCFVGSDDSDNIGLMDRAFEAMIAVAPYEQHLQEAVASGMIDRSLPLAEKLKQAQDAGVLTESMVEEVLKAEALRVKAIQVDHFSYDFKEVLTNASGHSTL